MRYDVAVIGSGPAGLEAAVNLKIRKKSFLLFGSENLSRKLEAAPCIDNYLGLPGISGKDLQKMFLQHLKEMEIPILDHQIQMIYPMGDYFALASVDQTYEASAVILCPGTFSAKLLDGEEEFLGRGVGYCATCDAPLYKGKTVAILGYTDESAREADFVSKIADKTYYVPMTETEKPGEGVEVDGVFVLRESVAPESLVPGLKTEKGFICVDADMATNIPGCYAAGDCTGKPHQYMRAAGQGQTAALNVSAYLDIKRKAADKSGK